MELSIAFPDLYEEIKDVWNDLKITLKFKKVKTLISNEIN